MASSRILTLCCIVFLAMMSGVHAADKMVTDGDRLVLTGKIDWPDSYVLDVALEINANMLKAKKAGVRKITTVVLDSDGGLVDEAMAIGRIIREHRLDTTVPCFGRLRKCLRPGLGCWDTPHSRRSTSNALRDRSERTRMRSGNPGEDDKFPEGNGRARSGD